MTVCFDRVPTVCSCAGECVCVCLRDTHTHPDHTTQAHTHCPVYRCAGGGRDAKGNPMAAELDGAERLCPHHVTRLKRALTTAAEMYAHLATVMAPGAGIRAERVRTSHSTPLAINVEARSLQEDMAHALRDAEREYRARRRWSPSPRRGREGVQVAGGSAWCLRHVDGLVTTDEGAELGVRLLRSIDATRRLLGFDRLVHRLPAPCPVCDSRGALRRDNGASVVRCRYCGVTFHEDEYARLVLILADDVRKGRAA